MINNWDRHNFLIGASKRQIRKATKHKSTFEKEERLLDYVSVVIKDFERNNWSKYPVSHFEKMGAKHN